ncbi:MAG: hypothetical protein C0609_10930 [Deltaproteobacteria bacterium]|nr:MAG: hypothetical protein C0609_10930 [Deltaproteobacteria bacterium]
MNFNTKLSYMSDEQKTLMLERVFTLLGKNGARLDHPFVLEKLAEAGAEVDKNTKIVRFPKELLEKVIKSAPSNAFHAGVIEENDFEVPRADGLFITRSGTGAPLFMDPETGKKTTVTIDNVKTWVKVVDALPDIDFCPFPSPSDIKPQVADIEAIHATFNTTGKHVWTQPYSDGSIEYLIRMAEVVAGGKEELKKRPVLSLITCSLTPLDFKHMDLDIIVQAAPLGLPLHLCSLPSAGTTAPITTGGVVLLAVAEILVMMAVTQTIAPGAPMVGTPLIFASDMSTGGSLQSSMEAMVGKATAVEFVKWAYGIPTHTYGFGSDTVIPDEQAAAESAMLASLISHVGCDILGGAGQLEVATIASPVQLIMDDEIAGSTRRLQVGVNLDDEYMAWDILQEANHESQFLSSKHTFKHCREALKTKNFSRKTFDGWEAAGKKTQKERALEKYRQIMDAEPKRYISEEQAKELKSVLDDSIEKLVK